MTESKDLSVPEKRLIGFKIKNEDWSIFQLIDNVLEKRSGKGFEGIMQLQNVLGVFSPEELRGKPSEPYTHEELAKSIVNDDIDIEKVITQPWNEYELDNGMVFKVKNILVNVAKTDKYDKEGMPIYLVNCSAFAKGKKAKKSKPKKK